MAATVAGEQPGAGRKVSVHEQGVKLVVDGDEKGVHSRSTTPIHFQHHPNTPQKLLRRLKSLSRHTLAKAVPSARTIRQSPPALPRIPSGHLPPPVVPVDVGSGEDSRPTQKVVEVRVEQRSAIKIRLVTFNMHDSLPEISGDLSEFLGEMGEAWSDDGPRWKGPQTSMAGSVVEVPSPTSLPAFPLDPDHPYHLIVVAGQECPTASGVLAGKMPRAWDGQGWTTILENWLCGGAEGATDDESTSERGDGSDEVGRGEEGKNQGPYVLVEKHRLIPGIYLAVFVARSCDGLVYGTSKGKVTAGLLGGRLGNKGAVAISLSFAGSRLLFISTHLAAHASTIGLANRKANVRKIFDEMVVDDFLPPMERRDGASLTDRFDQTFFMGDLNFRLQLSRLHADYLIKQQDYATALQFDQLRELLAQDDTCFPGFKEGPITFAPTYKYDVVARIKRKRSGILRSKSISTRPRGLTITTNAGSRPITPDIDNDTASIASSAGSMSSGMSDYDRVERSDLALPPTPTKGTESSLEAMKRAQVRFLTLVRSNSGLGDGKSAKKGLLGSGASTPTRPPILRRVSTAKEVRNSFSSGEERPVAIPVFDTSSKKRVQSYTDRILFKTTVLPNSIDSTPTPHSRSLSTAIVDSIRGLLPSHSPSYDTNPTPPLQHTYFAARPVLDHPSRKIHGDKSSEPWSDVASMAGDPRHSRFANFFGRGYRRDLRSMSVESLGLETEEVRAPKKLKRARSLTTLATRQRRISGTPSIKTKFDWHASTRPFWKRAGSSTGKSPTTSPLPTPPGNYSSPPAPPTIELVSSSVILSPPDAHVDSPNLSSIGSPLFTDSGVSTTATAPSTPVILPSTPPLKQHPARSQSVSNSPRQFPSSPPIATTHHLHSPSNPSRHRRSSSAFPRSPTRSSAREGSSGSNTFIRFKSFLHFLPAIPFLHRSSDGPNVVVEKVGPKRGEIQVIKYDAVTDLEAMGATSDHRPVFAVVAIGVGPPEGP